MSEARGNNPFHTILGAKSIWDFIWKVTPVLVTVIVSVGGVVFAAGVLYPTYRDLPSNLSKLGDRVTQLEQDLEGSSLESRNPLVRRITALEQRAQDLEKRMSELKPSDTSALPNNGGGPNVPAPNIHCGFETFAIMWNEDLIKRQPISGAFYLKYDLTQHMCDVNMANPHIEKEHWTPVAGDILKVTVPSKNLESWCMVVGLYTTTKTSSEAKSILINVSRPVATELGFREPLNLRMNHVVVSRVAEKDMTNPQKALRAKYGP